MDYRIRTKNFKRKTKFVAFVLTQKKKHQSTKNRGIKIVVIVKNVCSEDNLGPLRNGDAVPDLTQINQAEVAHMSAIEWSIIFFTSELDMLKIKFYH